MRFRIVHSTSFAYERPAYDSQNEIRLQPWSGLDQRCLDFALSVDQPAAVFAYSDYFGNRAHSLSVSAHHNALTIVTRSLVERIVTAERRYAEIPFEEFLSQDALRVNAFYEFLNSTRYIPFSERLRKFFWMAARPKPREDVAEYVMRVVAYVRDQFEYETSKTHVHSNLNDILKSGGGVCQDFAHLSIGLLRLAGVPARYVSGYLAPARSQGASADLSQQASHAWFEVWLPGPGWTGYDPTHSCRTGELHIGVAVGRDYDDVPPLRGTYRSEGGMSTMKVALSVAVESEANPAGQGHCQSQQ